MFDRIKSFFHLDAASQLPAVAPPKVRPGSSGFPSYLKTTKASDAVIAQDDRRLASTDTTTLRNGADTRTIIRNFAASSPELSAALWSYIRLGLPQNFTAVAKNPDNTFNREATLLVQQLITRFDLLPDYATDGFTGMSSVRATSEALAKELILYGSCAGEVVLDKARIPKRVAPISTTQVKFTSDTPGKALVPWQYIGSDQIPLDIPTFIYVSLDQDLLTPYSSSPIESAIKPVIYSESFSNTITRLVDKVIHPRQKVALNEEALRKNLSPEAQMDSNMAVQELNAIISGVESKINGLQPTDCLVHLDSIEFSVENPSNAGLASEYTVLQEMANARLSTGSKTNGTVLGFASGSSNIASSEIMLMMKSCTGAVKGPIEEFWSRALTLCARLMGNDVVVEFRFDPIDLRCDNELLAFKQTKQMMILEQLSYGFLSDDEASLALTGRLTPAGFKPLSGTRFKDQKASAEPATDTSTNGGSTLNQNLKPDTPDTARGQNKKKKAVAQPQNLTVQIDNTKQESAAIIRMKRDENGDLIVTKEATA